jgi:GH24 family phage-related lysozyme (muramidase)
VVQVTGYVVKSETLVSQSQYEFLGTPTCNPAVFDDGTYFTFVRETLKGISAANRQKPGTVVTNKKSFIGAFEGDRLRPYLDSERIPTIGVGINLKTVSGNVKFDLAQSVRKYYLAKYGKKLSRNDNAVIAMLRSQASQKKAPQAITPEDDQRLFDKAIRVCEDRARRALGIAYDRLKAAQQVAVVDLVYNVGYVFKGVADALKAGDYVLAGFNLVDAKRTTQARGLTNRTEAEYQNLLAGHLAELGRIVKTT